MRLDRLVAGMVAVCSFLVISAMPGFAGQVPKEPAQATSGQAKPHVGMAADMPAKCQAMMADREKMMAEMKAADLRLDDLVGKMNAAAGTQKADATAAVVNEMVSQRRTMRDGMMKMQQGMMAHMMEHMQAGKDAMAMCPMMKRPGSVKD
jgi:hypothetical protein